ATPLLARSATASRSLTRAGTLVGSTCSTSRWTPTNLVFAGVKPTVSLSWWGRGLLFCACFTLRCVGTPPRHVTGVALLCEGSSPTTKQGTRSHDYPSGLPQAEKVARLSPTGSGRAGPDPGGGAVQDGLTPINDQQA